VYYYDAHGRPNYLGGTPFRGFTAHKILAGFYDTLASLAAMASLLGWHRVFAICAFAYSVLLAGSAIGVIFFACGIPLFVAFKWAAARNISPLRLFLGSLIVLAPVVLIGRQYAGSVIGLLGRDQTLTNRTTLWQLGIEAFRERPILGWGFEAYLESTNGANANWALNRFSDWSIPHFHQSYLQTAVDLGVLGLLILTGTIVYILFASSTYTMKCDRSGGVFAFTAMLIMAGAGFVMFLFLTYNHFGTFLMFLLLLALKRSSAGHAILSKPYSSRLEPDCPQIRG
jgi:O-antigen ligase